MATLYDTATLQPIDIPDEDAPAAVLSGRYGLDASRNVVLFDPDGRAFEMPVSSAPQAFEMGYKFAPQTALRARENEEKYGALGSKLLSGGAGLLRGLTLGLSDRALRNVGVEAKTLRDLEEGAPITSGVGEVAGAVLPMAFSGGTSAAAQGAKASLPSIVGGLGSSAGRAAVKAAGLEGAKSIAGRAGAKALELGAAGAVEGALFGAGQAVTEDALGRADLNAESLIAHAGLGAALGLGSGALLGGGGSLATSGARKAVGAVKSKIGASNAQEILEDFAGERALKAALGQQKKAFTQLEDKGLTDRAKQYLLKEIGIDKFDNTESLAQKLASRRDALGSQIDDLVTKLDAGGASPKLTGEAIADRIEKEIVPKIDPVAQKSTRDAMQAAADGYRAAPGSLKFSEAAQMRRAAQANANYDAAMPRPTQQAWADVAKVWNNSIDEAAEPALKKLGAAGDAYKKAREEFSLAQRLTDYAEDRAHGNAANRFVSPSDYGVGGVVGLAAGDPVTGLASAAAHKVIRERGNAFAANAAYRLSKLAAVKKASDAVASRVDKAVARFVSGARTVAAPATVQTLFNTSFSPSNVVPMRKVASRKDAAKERARELAEFVSDPGAVTDRIAMAMSGLEESAPGISGQAAITASKALQFLHARAPKNPMSVHTTQPLLDDWQPNDAEVSKFERYVRAAFDPMTVLEDLESGTLTKEGVETMRELYPQLHAMTLEKLSEKLSQKKDRLPYEDRVNLSLLLGVPVDDTMRPDFISRTQQMWAEKPTEGGSGGQAGGGVGNLDLGGNLRTEAQRLEAKQ